MNLYQQFIAKSKYARYLDEKQRREHWPETVDRYFTFMKEHLSDKCSYELPQDLEKELRDAVINLEVMPSMRLMMTAGKACSQQNLTAYNCSALAIDDTKAFDELLYLLMCGAGVGFSVERQFVGCLPEIPEKLYVSDTAISVADSKAGWAKGLRQLIALLYSGEIPKWDLTKLRPKGARLKTFGGRSSGPEPLDRLFNFVVNIFKRAEGRKLNSVECHDICCKIAEVVVVGGTRRSALISLSNLSDDRMRKAKSGDWWNSNLQRRLANNSAVYTEKPEVGLFMQEWLSLYESKSGERGIFNRSAANTQAERTGRRKPYPKGWLVNPCQPEWATVLTPEGIRTLKDIKPGSVIWSGSEWTTVLDKWSTGIKPVYEYHTTSGVFIGTENHRVVQNKVKIEVKDAKSIDSAQGCSPNDIDLCPQDILEGWMVGDGSFHKASNRPLLDIGAKDECIFNSEIAHLVVEKYSAGKYTWITKTTLDSKDLIPLPTRIIPDQFFSGNSLKVRGFLRGLYSANGSICAGRITLKACSKTLILQAQMMLSSLGISSYYTTNKATEVKFENGTYLCKESYDLNIGQYLHKVKFDKLIGFVHPYKNDKLKKILEAGSSRKSRFRSCAIVNIVYVGDYEVSDLTVDTPKHTYWTGGLLVSNCGEVQLRDCGLCNLTESVLRPTDTFDSVKRKVRLAAILGTFQSSLTYFPYVRKTWRLNAEEERLLGVSLTGICDNDLFNNHREEGLDRFLTELRETVISVNKEFSETLGINSSVATTVVKPSGTVSQLVNCSSGIHPAHAPFYIRRVRSDNKDPLTKFMVEAGVPNEKSDANPEGETIFSFPMKTESAMTRKDLSAESHFKLWLMYKKYYTEHNPSITISVKEEEWPKMGSLVWENFEEVLGVSFLPYSDEDHNYTQLPYEEISEQQYKELLVKMPESLDWDSLVEFDDNVEGAQNLACTGGFCEI